MLKGILHCHLKKKKNVYKANTQRIKLTWHNIILTHIEIFYSLNTWRKWLHKPEIKSAFSNMAWLYTYSTYVTHNGSFDIFERFSASLYFTCSPWVLLFTLSTDVILTNTVALRLCILKSIWNSVCNPPYLHNVTYCIPRWYSILKWEKG